MKNPLLIQLLPKVKIVYVKPVDKKQCPGLAPGRLLVLNFDSIWILVSCLDPKYNIFGALHKGDLHTVLCLKTVQSLGKNKNEKLLC